MLIPWMGQLWLPTHRHFNSLETSGLFWISWFLSDDLRLLNLVSLITSYLGDFNQLVVNLLKCSFSLLDIKSFWITLTWTKNHTSLCNVCQMLSTLRTIENHCLPVETQVLFYFPIVHRNFIVRYFCLDGFHINLTTRISLSMCWFRYTRLLL